MAGGSPVPINDGGPLRRSHEEFEYVPGSYQSPRGCGPLCFGHWVPAFIQHSFGDTTVSLKALQEVEGIAGASIRDLRKKKGFTQDEWRIRGTCRFEPDSSLPIGVRTAKHHFSDAKDCVRCARRQSAGFGWAIWSGPDHPQSVCSVVPSQSRRVCLFVGACYYSSPGGMLRRSASRWVSYRDETSSGCGSGPTARSSSPATL
jgi:hypothetical protein